MWFLWILIFEKKKKLKPECNLFLNCLFIQAVGMFLGEFSCLIAFQIIKTFNRVRRPNQEQNLGNQSFNPLIFLPPALCDMCGTSLMYVGLNLTYASSFQMLRGNGREIYITQIRILQTCTRYIKVVTKNFVVNEYLQVLDMYDAKLF